MLRISLSSVFISAALMLGLVSCSSVTVSNKFNGQEISPEIVAPVAHINARCSGMYLFNAVPIVVGSTDWPGMFLLFCNTVKTENCVSMLTEQANNLGATKVIDLNSQTRVVPNDLLFYVLTSRTVEVSGNAVK